MSIKPIETVYKGYRFRSRLEARWAVFFDECKIKYEYEPEGFETEDGDKYLPDFYLPYFDLYVEVKPNQAERISELHKASNVIKWGGTVNAILILSEIPYENDKGLWLFPIMLYLSHYGVVRCWWIFFDTIDINENEVVSGSVYYVGTPKHINCFLQATPNYEPNICAKSELELQFEMFPHRERNEEDDDFMCYYYKEKGKENPLVFEALAKARSARFEHGECG
jgi:hypothetical protein